MNLGGRVARQEAVAIDDESFGEGHWGLVRTGVRDCGRCKRQDF